MYTQLDKYSSNEVNFSVYIDDTSNRKQFIKNKEYVINTFINEEAFINAPLYKTSLQQDGTPDKDALLYAGYFRIAVYSSLICSIYFKMVRDKIEEINIYSDETSNKRRKKLCKAGFNSFRLFKEVFKSMYPQITLPNKINVSFLNSKESFFIQLAHNVAYLWKEIIDFGSYDRLIYDGRKKIKYVYKKMQSLR